MKCQKRGSNTRGFPHVSLLLRLVFCLFKISRVISQSHALDHSAILTTFEKSSLKFVINLCQQTLFHFSENDVHFERAAPKLLISAEGNTASPGRIMRAFLISFRPPPSQPPPVRSLPVLNPAFALRHSQRRAYHNPPATTPSSSRPIVSARPLIPLERAFGPKEQEHHQLRDEEIKSNIVRITRDGKDRSGGSGGSGGLSPPQNLRNFLTGMDRRRFFLVQVSPTDSEDVPVCKVMTREAVFKREQEKAKLGAKKTTEQLTKEIELGWRMAEGDLAHRMVKLQEFLGRGRKVEITIAPKRKRDVVPENEARGFLKRVRAGLEELGGREARKLEGTVGKLVTLFVEPTQGVGVAIAGGDEGNEAGVRNEKAKDKNKRKKVGGAEVAYECTPSVLYDTTRRVRWLVEQGKDVRLRVWNDKSLENKLSDEEIRRRLNEVESTLTAAVPALRKIGEEPGGSSAQAMFLLFTTDAPENADGGSVGKD